MTKLMTTTANVGEGHTNPDFAGARFGAPMHKWMGAGTIAWNRADEGEGGSGNEGEDTSNKNDEGEGEGEGDGNGAEDEGDGDEDVDLGNAGDDVEALKAANAKLLKEVMKKKTALKDATKAADAANAALAAYEGLDPAKVKALAKAAADAEAAEAEARGDFDRVKAMMVEEHNKEKQTLQEQIEQLNAARKADQAVIADLTIGNSFSSSTYIKDELLLTPNKARKLYGAHFETIDGKTVAFDKPAGEQGRTMMVNGSGEPLSFDEGLKRLIEADPDRDTLVKVKLKQGGHSSTTTSDKSGTEKKATTELYGVSRIAASLGDFTSKKS